MGKKIFPPFFGLNNGEVPFLVFFWNALIITCEKSNSFVNLNYKRI